MKKQYNILLVLLVFVMSIKAQNVNLDLYTDANFARNINTNLLIGYTVGGLNVGATGGAGYSIPIALPPGTKGIEPSLSVNYNSQSGNSVMGMGWSVAASSGISRTAKNHHLDNEVTAVKLNNEDFYALDGNRLEVTSGVYSSTGSQYATKMETFSKITANGNVGGSPQWFKVEAKNGMTYEYGFTPDSRLMTEDNSKIISWQLNKTYDQYGNFINYVYEMNGREMRIKEINYTGNDNPLVAIAPYNKVKFNYLNRLDTRKMYIVGSTVEVNSLLTEIVVTTEGNAQVRKYAFNYAKDNINQSYLRDVIEFGSDNSQLNSTIFKYGNKTSDVTQEIVGNSATTGETNFGDVFTGDFNGDGLTDYVYAVKSNVVIGGTYLTYYTGLKIYLKDNTSGSSFTSVPDIVFPINTVMITPEVYANANSSFVFSDFNGDGKADILVLSVPPSTGSGYVSSGKIYMAKFDGTGTFANPVDYDITYNNVYENRTCQDPDSGPYDCSVYCDYKFIPETGKFIFNADFNGDGLTDIITIFGDNCTTGSFKNIFSVPNTGYKTEITGSPLKWGTADKIEIIDFNGDGKADLMVTKDGRSVIHSFSNTGAISILYDSGFPTKWHEKLLLGDFNGDGKTDFLTRASNVWRLAYSNGQSFNEIVFPFTSVPNLDYERYRNLQVGDYDGNGMTDVLYMTTNPLLTGTRTFDIYFSNGNSFTKKTMSTNVSYYGRPETVGDFNGDGKTDIMFRGAYNSPSYINYFTPNSKDQLLEKATNGFNVTSSVVYRNMTDRGGIENGIIYTSAYNNTSSVSSYPLNNIRFPMWLAASLTSPNGIGGNATNSYKYKDVKLHRKGAGFLGFGGFQVDNPTQNTQVITEMEILTPQYVPAVKKVTNNQIITTLNTPTKLAETINTNTISTNGTRYWMKVDATSSTNFLTNGMTSSTNTYDANGNVTFSSSNVNNEEYAYVWYNFTNEGFNAFGSPYFIYSYKERVGQARVYKQARNTYNAQGGVLTSIDYDFNGSWQTTGTSTNTYYSATGSLLTTSITSPSLQAKTTTLEYDAKHRYVTKTTNPLGQYASKTYDPRWGTLATERDVAGLLTTYKTYDSFGRLLETVTPQGHSIMTRYSWNNPNANLPTRCYDVITTVPGKPTQWDTYDAFGRKTVATNESYGAPQSRWVYTYVVTEFDSRGNVSTVVAPINGTDWANRVTTTYNYDGLNRLTTTAPTSANTTIGSTSYGYLPYNNAGKTTVTVTNAAGQVSSKTTEASGKVISTTDNGGTLTFEYDSRGNQKNVKLGGLEISSMTYDYRGNQTALTDKNAGKTEYTYNAYGELEWQKDANANIYTMAYDVLGRLITRTGPEGVTTNEYVPFNSSYSNFGVNQIKKITNVANGITQEYIYDSWQRITNAQEKIDNVIYTKSFTYRTVNNMPTSDVETTTYPSGLVVTNSYSVDGYLFKVNSGAQVLFEGTNGTINGLGKWQNYQLGNGITTNVTYNNLGMPTNFQAYGVQDLSLNWNLQTGNLTSRIDYRKGKTETFGYTDNGDNLNRLTSATVTGLATMSFNYAANGNISSKSDAGTYAYDANKINAVTGITGNPQTIPSFQQDIVYTKFLRPEKLTEAKTNGTYELTYTYASDYERRKGVLKLNNAVVNTRLYMGDYEIDTKNGVTRHIHYISGGDGICAIVVKEASNYNYFFPYTDHLGSILTVTNASGTVVAEQNFDAWGRKRNATTWEYANIAAVPDWLYRGYTGHEHLPEFGLINMNARLYDPVLGRMLSPDNYVGEGGTQGFNRYSYANNNPLKFIDPSGNNPLIIAGLVSAAVDIGFQLIGNGGNLNAINWTSVGISFVAGVAGAGIGQLVGKIPGIANAVAAIANPFWRGAAQGAIVGAAGGAAGGFTTGLLQGQSGLALAKTTGSGLLFGGIIGGVVGGVSSQRAYNKAQRLASDKFNKTIRDLEGKLSTREQQMIRGGSRESGIKQGSIEFGETVGQFLEPNELGEYNKFSYGGSSAAPSVEQYTLPNSTEYVKHHIFPQKFRTDFEAFGINIDDYTKMIPRTMNGSSLPGQLHYAPQGTPFAGRGGYWNAQWSNFLNTKPKSASEIFNFAEQLMYRHGLNGPYIKYK